MLLNGVFAGAEIAILSIRRTRLSELVDAGDGGAKAVALLRENPERFLATVQIGVTVVSATAAAFGGASIAERLAEAFELLPGLAPYADSVALALVVVAVSFLSLVLGELVPKSLALRYAESYGLVIGPPLGSLSVIARPLVWLLTTASNAVLRFFGDRTNFSETRLSADELQQMIGEAATAGAVDPEAGEIASRAIDFSDLDASSVMVPRQKVVTLNKSATADEVVATARSSGFARVPVWEGYPDNIVGQVNLREALGLAWQDDGVDLGRILHVVPFIPLTMSAPDILRELQRKRSHMAIVVDEEGGLQGLLTMEDLVEELVGDILSEDDTPEPPLTRESDGSVLVPGNTPIRSLSRALAIDLPEGETWSTIAGLCIDLAGNIPQSGETLVTPDGHTLEVVDASPRRIRLVRVRPAAHG